MFSQYNNTIYRNDRLYHNDGGMVQMWKEAVMALILSFTSLYFCQQNAKVKPVGASHSEANASQSMQTTIDPTTIESGTASDSV